MPRQGWSGAIKREEGRCFKFYAPFLRSKTERLSEAVGGASVARGGARAERDALPTKHLKNFSR